MREQHVLAPVVERAVGRQWRTRTTGRLCGRHRVRVTGQLLDRLTLAVQHVGDHAQVVGDLETTIGKGGLALQRGEQGHVGLGVGIGGRITRFEVLHLRRITARADAEYLAVHGDRAPFGGAIETVGGVVRAIRVRGEFTRAAQHRIFLGLLGAHAEPAAFEGLAEVGAVRALLAVAFAVLADVGADVAAIEVLAGDDVDHAGDGVGAVQRRGAVGEHFNALDDGRWNRADV
ncbi:hypothetical protein D3C81_671070 [compost metagenome]